MADDITRDWCEHCQQYVKRRTKRRHADQFYNPVTKVWKRAHNDYVHNIDDSEFQFSSSDEDGVEIQQHIGNTSNDCDKQNEKLLTSDEDESTDDDVYSTTDSESSTDISDCEEWLDVDHDQLLKKLREEENTPVYKIQHGAIFSVEKKFLTILVVFLLIWKSVNLISNNAFEILLEFLKMYLHNLGLHSLVVAGVAVILPTTMYTLHKILGIDRNDFTRFIVCQTCLKLHDISLCDLEPTDRRLLCDNIPFQRGKYGKRCNSKLIREINLKNGQPKCYPLKMYCYKSLLNTLEDFLCRPGFEDKCEEWKKLPETEFLTDVYDGKVWHDFLQVNSAPFLSKSHNFAFVLNVDWFQPYERRKDISIGAIYMVLLNLPRHLRYKRENVFLIGIIPNLRKEPKSLNSFLEPLVKELRCLWRGITLKTNNFPKGKEVRAAILCAAADIPAARKLCGFLGHSATLGCSKCLKKCSSSFGESRNYGGFDRSEWNQRSHSQHVSAVRKLNTAKTKTARENMEKKLGYRYSKLLDLSYMDCVRFCVIDPMHNLFLGTAKHIWRIWIENDLLSETDVEAIEKRIEKLKFPSDVGRLPTSISSNWGGFTAEQWKTWTLTISLYALTGILTQEHLKVWHTFVRACQKICRPAISKSDAKIADALFLKFGKEFEALYGPSKVTPNIHLHCHLFEVIRDFGSIYGFWLFSFERYNGLLGSFCNNKRDIEIQIMREFLSQDQLFSLLERLPSELKKSVDLSGWINKCKNTEKTYPISNIDFFKHNFPDMWSNYDFVTADQANKLSVKCFDADELGLLQQCYQVMYKDEEIAPSHLSHTYTKLKSLRIGSDFLSSKCDSQSSRSKYIMAVWIDTEGKATLNGEARPCRIKHFIEHTLRVNAQNIKHMFAVVEWFKKCESCNDQCCKYPSPVSVWLQNKYERPSSGTFLPVQKYLCKFVFGPCLGHENDHIAVLSLN